MCIRDRKKGSQIYIEGRIQTRKWTDKEGQERYSTEIVANEMKMLGKREGMGAPADNDNTDYAPAPRKDKPKPSFDDLGDDIPVSYTHLDVYKRQPLCRRRERGSVEPDHRFPAWPRAADRLPAGGRRRRHRR